METAGKSTETAGKSTETVERLMKTDIIIEIRKNDGFLNVLAFLGVRKNFRRIWE